MHKEGALQAQKRRPGGAGRVPASPGGRPPLETNPQTNREAPRVQEGIEPGVRHVDVGLIVKRTIQFTVGHSFKGTSIPSRVGAGISGPEPGDLIR